MLKEGPYPPSFKSFFQHSLNITTFVSISLTLSHSLSLSLIQSLFRSLYFVLVHLQPTATQERAVLINLLHLHSTDRKSVV